MTIYLLSSAVTSSTVILRIGIAAKALLFVMPAFPLVFYAYAAARVYYVLIDCYWNSEYSLNSTLISYFSALPINPPYSFSGAKQN